MARSRLPSLRYFSFKPLALSLSFLLALSCDGPKKSAASKQAMQAELQELKAKSAEEALRIKELELALQEQKNSENLKTVLEEAQQKSQAEFEAAQKQQTRESEIHLTEDKPVGTDQAPENGDGFSFVAVRTVSAPAPASPSPSPQVQPVIAAPVTPLSPQAQRLTELRGQLRDELTEILDKVREHRRARYGDVDSTGNRTYIQMSSYDPETGKNKRGGGKAPKLDVDLENGINQEFPEKSTCFNSQSLSATLSHARLLRDEISEFKGQYGLK